MARLVVMIALVATGTGCASTWEKVSSRQFRDDPMGVMFGTDDPLAVLRVNPDGEARARAMRRLKEPAQDGRSEAEQEEAVQILATAAASDSSPWVRMAAIDALGRFEDPRAVGALTAAYHAASGKSEAAAQPTQTPAIVAAGGRVPGSTGLGFGLGGPQGFPSDQEANIRGRALEALAKTGRPEAVSFLAQVAAGRDIPPTDDPTTTEFVRQRAVAGLGEVHSPEAVHALAQVLAAEHGKDVTLTNLAHGGLVSLTGQQQPADPQVWNEIVQAGFEVTPE